jgi:hypothetical protein
MGSSGAAWFETRAKGALLTMRIMQRTEAT